MPYSALSSVTLSPSQTAFAMPSASSPTASVGSANSYIGTGERLFCGSFVSIFFAASTAALSSSQTTAAVPFSAAFSAEFFMFAFGAT